MRLRPLRARLRQHGPVWLSLALACPVGLVLGVLWLLWHGTLLYARALGFWRDAPPEARDAVG